MSLYPRVCLTVLPALSERFASSQFLVLSRRVPDERGRFRKAKFHPAHDPSSFVGALTASVVPGSRLRKTELSVMSLPST